MRDLGEVREFPDRLTASYYPLDANGAPVSTPWALDHWYRYDALHRVVVDKGTLSGSQIVLGTRLTYDAAGQRVTSTQTVTENRQELWWHDQWGVPQYPVDWDPEGGWGWTKQWILVPYNANRAEHYDYRADGALTQVRIGDNGATPQLKATFVYDAMGRLTRQTDWIGNGTNAAYDRYSIVYNAAGQVVSESVASRQGADTWTSYITNSYGTGTLYALGAALTTTTSDYRNGSYQYATTTTNTYGWYDGAVLSQVSYAKTGQATYNTYYSYTAMGTLTSVSINDGRPRTVTYTNDLNGQAIRRSEADTYYAQGDPHELWYRYAGREVGHASNNSTLETNYTTSIENRQKVTQPGTGAFRWGAVHPTGYGEFGQGVAPINSYAQGSAGGAYTVRTGETLASIAAGRPPSR